MIGTFGRQYSALPRAGGSSVHDDIPPYEVLPAARLDPLRLAAAAYLARYKGQSRIHTECDLRAYLRWCAERRVDPLDTSRVYIELYVRWMQEERRYAPSTVSRRLSTVAGFYRTCVIDGVLAHSPAEHVRRPPVTTLSPTLGLSHLQFEAMLNASRCSSNPNDFALVCLLGLLGLRIMEATGLDIDDLGEEHGHRVVRVLGKGTKVALIPMPPAVARAVDRAVAGRTEGAASSQPQRPPHATPLRRPPTAPAAEDRRRAHRPHAPAHAAAHLRHHDA